VPSFKPATLAAPPSAVARLTPRGDAAAAFRLSAAGLAVDVGAAAPGGAEAFAYVLKVSW